MGVKVTGQFEPAGSFSIVDGKDISGNITGSEISASGGISASSFSGDGSGLTGLSNAAINTVTNFDTNDRLITVAGTSAVNAESNLTFDGTTLGVTGNITTSGNITASGDISGSTFKGKLVDVISGSIDTFKTSTVQAKDNTGLLLCDANVAAGGDSSVERGIFIQSGQVGIGTNSQTKKLHVSGGISSSNSFHHQILDTVNYTIGHDIDQEKFVKFRPDGIANFGTRGFVFSNDGDESILTISASTTPHVGIGTLTPNATLEVDGTISSSGLGTFNDVVFKDGLSISTLSSSFSTRVTTLEGLDRDDDLTVRGDTGGDLTIDLDTEKLEISGGAGIETAGSGNGITINLSSNVGGSSTIGEFNSLTINNDLQIKSATNDVGETAIFKNSQEMITFDGVDDADRLKVTINKENLNLDFKVGGSTDDRLLQTDAANNNIVFADQAGSQVGIGDFLGTDASNTFGSEKFKVVGTSLFTNDITIQGNITGDDESNISGIKNITTLGNSSFGNAITDTHTFNGHITASGNISSNGNVFIAGGGISGSSTLNLRAAGRQLINMSQTNIVFNEGQNDVDIRMESAGNANGFYLDANRGKVGIMHAPAASSAVFQVTGDLKTNSHITASGNISASGNVITNHITASGNISASGAVTANNLVTDFSLTGNNKAGTATFAFKGSDGNNIITAISVTNNNNLSVGNIIPTTDSSKFTVAGDINTTSHITASGNISASGTVFASAFSSPDGDGDIDFSDSLDVSGNITASGDISASGNLSATGNLDIDGTATIDGKLTVNNDIDLTNDIKLENTKQIQFKSAGVGGSTVASIRNDTNNNLSLRLSTANKKFDFENSSGTTIATLGGSSTKLDVTGDIEASGFIKGNHITASGNISSSQNLIAKKIGLGLGGHSPNSLFYIDNNPNRILSDNIINITGSKPSEINFTNDRIGGANGTDTISGSTIGVISFAGKTEYDLDPSNTGQPYDTYEDGAAEGTRLLSHMRGGVLVYKDGAKGEIPFRTGGFLSFHTGADSASYSSSTAVGFSDNERMRIDPKGNVGIGFLELDAQKFVNSKLQVNRNIVVSSSLFTEFNPGPSMIFKGLRSGSTEQLPMFRIGQVKAGVGIGENEINTNVSGAFEIRARKVDTPLDTAGGPDSELIAMHIRTYNAESNEDQGEYDGNIDSAFFPHKGANFGFNMNNPDGFNVNVRQTTLGLSDANAIRPNILNLRGSGEGSFQIRSETDYTINTQRSNNILNQDITDYLYDNIGLGDGEDGEDTQDFSVTLNNFFDSEDDLTPWINPNPDSTSTPKQQTPIGWSWAFSRAVSDFIYPSEAGVTATTYSATGSVISMSLDFEAPDGFSDPKFVWSASMGEIFGDNDPFTWHVDNQDNIALGSHTLQASASQPTNALSTEFPTFDDNGEWLESNHHYKWRIELNKSSGDASAPTQLITTSSARFTYTDGDALGTIPGDINADETINVLDVVQLVNGVLGTSDLTDAQEAAGDMNQDGILNILDVVQLVNIVLGGGNAIVDTMNRRGYDTTKNKVFRELEVEKNLLLDFTNSLSSSGVTATSLGTAASVSSSLNSFLTSSGNFMASGSRITSISTRPFKKRLIKPKLGTDFGYNFIESITGSEFNLNGVVEGSTLLFNSSVLRNVEEVFITSSGDVHYVRLDEPIPSSSISGSYFKSFNPQGFGLVNKPVFTNRGKTIKNNKGLMIRPGDGKIGVGTSRPQAILHISASVTGSGGKVNDTLFKIDRTDGAEYKVTDEEILFKDKLGNVSRRKFNSSGQEVLISGSGDTSESEQNQIIFDQTGDGGAIILSGSSNTNSVLTFVGPTVVQQIKPLRTEYTTFGGGTNQFHTSFNTSSGIFELGPGSIGSTKNAIQIDQNANVTFTDGAITASNDISSSGNVLASNVFINGENALKESGGKGFLFDDAQITELQIGKQATVTKTTISGDIEAVGHITASNNISSSGTITSLSGSFGRVDVEHLKSSDDIELNKDIHMNSTSQILLNSDNTISDYRIFAVNNTGIVIESEDGVVIPSDSPLEVASHITASNNISSSGTITGNELKIGSFTEIGADDSTINRDLSVGRTLTLTSGNISGSIDTDLNYGGATIHGVNLFGPADTTPDVSNGTVFKTNNGSSISFITITGFDNGTAGQIIHIIIADSKTRFSHGSNLKLSGATGLGTAENDTISFICLDGTVWLELSRSDNT